MTENKTTQCGTVAIIGRPNAGKSTLLNQLIGQKISITSRKPQTTRHQILGVYTEDNVQVIFVDTPGIHARGDKAINKYMNNSATSMLHDVDVVLWVLEGTRWLPDDELVLQHLRSCKTPTIVVINKIDKVKDKSGLLPFLDGLREKYPFFQAVPVSAKNGYQVDILRRELATLMPVAPFGFESDEVTNRPMRFLVAEIIREKAMRQLGDEVPYDLTVEIESWTLQSNVIHLHGLILVDKPGQKAIVIGKGGQRLKAIGTQARLDIEKLVESKVMLNLWVKVKSGWSDDERALQSLGYD